MNGPDAEDTATLAGHLELASRALYRQLLFSMDIFCSTCQMSHHVLLEHLVGKYPNLMNDFPKMDHDVKPFDKHEQSALSRYGPVPPPVPYLRRIQQHFVEKGKTYFPPLIWIPEYKINLLLYDILAGLTIGVFLVPQGMAYALLAGLPVEIGLYSSTIPVLIYALFGTSRQMAIGPFALVALLVFGAISGVPPPELTGQARTDALVQASVNLMMYVGIILAVLGLLRMGFISNFISKSFLAGFTSASGLTIQTSQLPGLAGIKVPSNYSAMSWIEQVITVIKYLPTIFWPTLLTGLVSLAVVIIIETVNVRKPLKIKNLTLAIPSALIVIIFGVLISYLANFNAIGIKVVGYIPSGFNKISIPSFDQFSTQYVNAIIIALIVYLSSSAISLRYAEVHNYETDNNQEMIALGLMNLVGSFFSGFVACGAMSRSAVANSAGARSPLYGIITALVVILILFVATPVLYYLPSACLSAMIFVAAYGLWDFMILRSLWKIRKVDFLVWWVSFFATLFLSASTGLLLALAFSILAVVYQTSMPHIAILGRLPRTLVWRNIQRFPDALVIDGLLVVRIDADFFFANIRYIHSSLVRLIEREKSKVHVLLLDLSAVSDVDFSAVSELQKTMKWLRGKEIVVLATAVNGPVRDMLKRSRFLDLLGEENVFWMHSDAVAAAKSIIRKRRQDEPKNNQLVPLHSFSEFGGTDKSFIQREHPKPQLSFWQKLI